MTYSNTTFYILNKHYQWYFLTHIFWLREELDNLYTAFLVKRGALKIQRLWAFSPSSKWQMCVVPGSLCTYYLGRLAEICVRAQNGAKWLLNYSLYCSTELRLQCIITPRQLFAQLETKLNLQQHFIKLAPWEMDIYKKVYILREKILCIKKKPKPVVRQWICNGRSCHFVIVRAALPGSLQMIKLTRVPLSTSQFWWASGMVPAVETTTATVTL